MGTVIEMDGVPVSVMVVLNANDGGLGSDEAYPRGNGDMEQATQFLGRKIEELGKNLQGAPLLRKRLQLLENWP